MIDIFRNINDTEEIICSIADDNARIKKAIMGVDEVVIDVTVDSVLDIAIGDHMRIDGIIYELNRDPEFNQKSAVEHQYSFTFEHPLYRLLDKLYINKATQKASFTLTGRLSDFVELLIWNINKTEDNPNGVDTGWTVGSVPVTDYKTLTFGNTLCRDILTKLADDFNVEFFANNKEINFVDHIENETELVFSQGRGKGLYTVSQKNVDTDNAVTRVYPIGGIQNVPAKHADADGHLILPEAYIENFTEYNKIVERVVEFNDIFPSFTGTIASVAGENNNVLKCVDIDFDINKVAVGDEARINFLSGDLMGKSFVFQWSDEKKEITLIEQEDDTALPDESGKRPTIPSALKKVKVSDEFNFTGLNLPETYFSNAIDRLRKAAADWLEFYSRKRIKFELSIDHRYLRGKQTVYPGDLVSIKVPDHNIDKVIRVTSVDKKIKTGELTCVVSNYLDEKWEKKIEGQISSMQTTVGGTGGGLKVDILERNDIRPVKDSNVFSAVRSRFEFINKKKQDIAEELITFLKGIILGKYIPGSSGATIDGSGNAEFLSTVIRTLLRSTKFVDGMLGEGFQLWMDEKSGLANLTLDKLTVRQVMVVLELLIERVRSIGGQFVVSAANGKIKEIVRDGDVYEITFEQDNTFVEHDLMRCATLSGVKQRSYWVEISKSDTKGITVPVSEFGEAIPEPGDECVLMGNTTNVLRQNLISIAATEDGQPRVDVLDGVKTKNFVDCLRVRLGNLDGIKDERFPLDNQPDGNGLFGDNVFLVGTFILTTGEDILTRFEIVEGKIQTAIESVRHDFISDKSYLNNPTFSYGMDSWDTENEAVFFTIGGKWLWVNDAPLTNKTDYACVKEDKGRTAVFIHSKYILQKHENFKSLPEFKELNPDGLKKSEAIYLAFFYRCASAGHLTIEFVNTDNNGFEEFDMFLYESDIEASEDYLEFNHQGAWNGTGDFKLSFTGDIYIYMLVLSTDRVNSLVYKYRTLFEQSDKLLRIAAENFDINGNPIESSQIVTKADMNLITSGLFDETGSLVSGAGLVTKNDVAALFAIGSDGSLKSFVGASTDGVKIKADNITLEGIVTANENFQILEDGSIKAKNADITGKITASDGNIGYFSINNEGLYYGDPSKWSDISYKQDLAALTPGLIRLQSEESYFVPGDIANIKVAIGNGSDPSITGSGKSCYSAGYFYRQMNANSGDWYTPAVKIISDNVVNRDVALYTDGAIVCQGGLLSSGHFNDANSVTVLDFSFGSTVLIYNTAYRYVYLPTLSNMKQLLNSTGVFAVFVRLVARYENNESFKVAFQDGQTSLYFRNNNGAHYGNDIDMGSGDILELLLIYDGGNYYAQVVDRKT